MDRQARGRDAEDRAVAWLGAQGYRVLARNYRTARGELDVVAEREGVLCFVEVRARGRGAHVGALESVDARKRARLVLAAQAFLVAHKLMGRPARFDVIAVAEDGAILHVPGAFDAGTSGY